MSEEERYPDENAGGIDDPIVQQQKQLTDSDAPPEVKKRYYSFMDRDSVYTNIPEKELKLELWKLDLDQTELVFWRDLSMKADELTFQVIMDDVNAARIARNRLYRAVNGEFIKRLVPDIRLGYSGSDVGEGQQAPRSSLFDRVRRTIFGGGGQQ